MFALHETQQLRGRVLLLDDGVTDVGPVETADESPRSLQLQPLKDVLAGQVVGGGCQCDAWHRGKTLVQHAQRPVFGPEVMPPLAHAMRLVDRKQAEFAPFVQRIELGQETRRRDPLGRDVDQRDLTAQHAALHLRGLITALRRIQKGGINPGLVQGADLVMHQCDQRRHHDRRAKPLALAHDGGDLVTQRLAAPGGHQHQCVAAGAHVVNHRLLWAAKLSVAKYLAQHPLRLGRRARVPPWRHIHYIVQHGCTLMPAIVPPFQGRPSRWPWFSSLNGAMQAPTDLVLQRRAALL